MGNDLVVNQDKHAEFYERLRHKTREELLELIALQDPETITEINRIEYVFRHELDHLTWQDGSPVQGRDLTTEELIRLVDPIFIYDKELARLGFNEHAQRQIHIASDPVLWSKQFLNIRPRVYQTLMLRSPNEWRVMRLGRRMGKSYSLAMLILWYAYTNKDARVLVMSPMKTQVGLLFEAIQEFREEAPLVDQAIERAVAAPQYEMNFTNGSTVRFFTTGMKSGGKSDVARGQEADLIVLDEMDYMGAEDLVALMAMMQKTSKKKTTTKALVGASTPTGLQSTFWEWNTKPEMGFEAFWFPSYCFTYETLITMADGTFKMISDIQIGDSVLTEKGPKKVLKTFAHPHSGEVFKLTSYGDNKSVTVTGEHPFYAAPRKRRQKDYAWDWTEVKALKVGDSRDQSSGIWLQTVHDIAERHVEFDLAEMFEPLARVEDRVKLHRSYKKGVGREHINSMPTVIDNSDQALAVLCGWYLAEGHLEDLDKEGHYRTVGFTLHKNEVNELNRIQLALDKLGAGVLSRSYRNNIVCLRVNNVPLAKLLQYLCGQGSKTKKLSSELMQAPIDFQETMLLEYADGDGYYDQNGQIVFRTSSRVLSKQIQILGGRINGSLPSITEAPGRWIQINDDYDPYWQSESYAVNWDYRGTKTQLGKKKLEDGKYATLLKSKKSMILDGMVYNFEVEDTNSYIANGLLVHNCNPEWTKETEDKMRMFYRDPNNYRHEIEADWGEPADGVYPRWAIDKAFLAPGWEYRLQPEVESHYIMGVDWDKYGAGVNLVMLEVCGHNYHDTRLAGKVRVCYREEVNKGEFTILAAIDRILFLDQVFHLDWLYIDRGYGDTQLELIKKRGMEDPAANNIHLRTKGFQFSEVKEIRDPFNQEIVKKDIKSFMVDNLYRMLEMEQIKFSEEDDELYLELISYVVLKNSAYGKPIFGPGGAAADHAHDALLLAALGVADNYDDLLRIKFARKSYAVNADAFMNLFAVDSPADREAAKELEAEGIKAPVQIRRAMSANVRGQARNRRADAIKRKMF